MPVFVDPLVRHTGDYQGTDADQAQHVGARNGHQWCHLFSDEKDPSFPELIAFGLRLGMRRAWFQGDHWDLTPGRRAAAVKAGATECTYKEAVAIWRTTPRARKYRCRNCGHTTERRTAPPEACPGCGARI